ncbi:MAG: nucleoside transporter C-terminal domain-containing protein [Pseudomonadota bacterium]
MQFVSVLGLIALLGLAYAMSFDRSSVKLRPVFWGLGLQFVLALIILREDVLSFIGMGALGLLVIAYLFDEPNPDRGAHLRRNAVIVAASAAVGAGLVFAPSIALSVGSYAAIVVLLVNARLKFLGKAKPAVGALVVLCGVAWLVSEQVYGRTLFGSFSDSVGNFLTVSDYGARFLFGNFADPEHYFVADGSPWPGFGFLFAFKVLPTIIFFGGLMSVLYYFGIVQVAIEALAKFMRWTIGTSGAETMSCTANIFVGQTEAPLLVRPFLSGMTKSELLTIMVGGFATIAGGVLAGYIAMGVPAGHLIAAAVMSAPAALVVGKIIFPETEESQTSGVVALPEIDVGDNAVEAASRGITDGLKLAVNVGAMLLGFIALIAVLDLILGFADGLIDGKLLGGERIEYAAVGLSPITGEYVGYFPGSLQTLFGTLLRPLAFLMGVPWEDAALVGNLLGVKLALNEFVSYGTLGTYIQNEALGERGMIISTYALCGFANFSSIGIQVGGIGALAPERRPELAALGMRAMFGGAIASWLTAVFAGMLLI